MLLHREYRTRCGFVSIDSAPLQRKYVTALEIWLLMRMEPVYRYYPWKWLLRTGSKGVAVSAYGRMLMYDTMKGYEGQQDRYAKLAGHGFRILADAPETVNRLIEEHAIRCEAEIKSEKMEES